MGYCAKARIYSHIYCVIALLSIVSNQVKEMHGASAGSSWPSMKTYDIWGTSHMQTGSSASTLHNGDDDGSSIRGGGGTMTAANDMVIQDYRQKTSFRDGKGMGNRWRNCVNSIYDSFMWSPQSASSPTVFQLEIEEKYTNKI